MSKEAKDAHYRKIGYDPITKTWKDNNNGSQHLGSNSKSKVKYGPNITRTIKNVNQWDSLDDDEDEMKMTMNLHSLVLSLQESTAL